MSKKGDIIEKRAEDLKNRADDLSWDISDIEYRIRVLIDDANKDNVLKKGSDVYDSIESLINEFTSLGAYLKDILEHPEKVDLEPREIKDQY